jgi:hypothetical protein
MLFGVTKQVCYKYDENSVLLKVAREEFVLQYIHGISEKDHGIGGMKLWHMYRKEFGVNSPVGRDRFADMVDRYGLKVRQGLGSLDNRFHTWSPCLSEHRKGLYPYRS